MSETLFRLNVWRPAHIERALMYDHRNVDGESISELQEGRLHEQVYGWWLEGDVWTALGNDVEGNAIKESLTSNFECSLPPHKRGFDKMIPVLAKLKKYMNRDGNGQWQTWPQLTDETDHDSTYQVQPLLALYHHLQWLCEVFQDIPGASITVR